MNASGEMVLSENGNKIMEKYVESKGISKKACQVKASVILRRKQTTIRIRGETMCKAQAILQEAGVSLSEFCERCVETLIERVERERAESCEEIQRVIRELWQKR